jgi:hypothetical protein
VRHLGYHVGYCSTVEELSRLVVLADLVEVLEMPGPSHYPEGRRKLR